MKTVRAGNQIIVMLDEDAAEALHDLLVSVTPGQWGYGFSPMTADEAALSEALIPALQKALITDEVIERAIS